jgi:hypothetical protein
MKTLFGRNPFRGRDRGHITTLSSPFNQHPRTPLGARNSLPLPSGHAPVATPRLSGTVVEVNGIEPMTSCLQSRRSPS